MNNIIYPNYNYYIVFRRQIPNLLLSFNKTFLSLGFLFFISYYCSTYITVYNNLHEDCTICPKSPSGNFIEPFLLLKNTVS